MGSGFILYLKETINAILCIMNTLILILGIYLISIVAWVAFLFSKKGKARRLSGDKFDKVFAYISIPFAPICWIIGLIVVLGEKKKKDRPLPLPKSLLSKLKKDCVSFNGKVMSISEVNRITGKNYTLEDVYGKKYMASLNMEYMNPKTPLIFVALFKSEEEKDWQMQLLQVES